MEICFDRHLKYASPVTVFRAWGLKDGWLNQNEVITYSHGGGVTTKHKNEWEEVFREVEGFTNLTFKKGTNWNTSILRIEYAKTGSWSFVGNDNYHVGSSEPTTNIGWYGKGTKRHELGHFVGLGHEHQTPQNPIKWDKEKVYEVMGGPPNNWSREQTDWNFFGVYDKDLTIGTSRDPQSIMMYSIPAEFTLDGFSAGYNDEFSEKDISFLSGIYPKEETSECTDYMIVKSFISTYMGNNPNQLKKLYAKQLKEIAAILNIKYKNKKTTAEAIIKQLKK